MSFKIEEVTLENSSDGLTLFANTLSVTTHVVRQDIVKEEYEHIEAHMEMVYSALNVLNEALLSKLPTYNVNIPKLGLKPKQFCHCCKRPSDNCKMNEGIKFFLNESQDFCVCSNCVKSFIDTLLK